MVDTTILGFLPGEAGTGSGTLEPVLAANTAGYTAIYDNGASGVGATLTNDDTLAAFEIDGLAGVLNGRYLIRVANNGADCGIYTLTTVGDGSTPWVLTRATDFDTPEKMAIGTTVFSAGWNTFYAWGFILGSTITTVGSDSVDFYAVAAPIYSLPADPADGVQDMAFQNSQQMSVNLQPVMTDTYTLGTVPGRWGGSHIQQGFFEYLQPEEGGTLTIRAYDVDGATYVDFAVLTSSNTPTFALGTNVTGVTQAPGDNSTKLATTAYVDATGGGTVTSVSGTANRITSTGGATPVIDISASYVGQASITTLGTVTTGTWSATNIALNKGGTNAALTASNGGIVYSDASAMAILSGTATAGQIIRSGSNAAPSWSTATYPATTTANQILYSSAANTIAGLATNNNRVLVTDGSGVPSLGTALPSGITATTQSPGTNNTTVATTAYVDAAAVTGGAILLLATATASNSPSLNFTTNISSTYDDYIVKMVGLVPATDGITPWARVSTDGGSTYVNSGTPYTYTVAGEGTGTTASTGANQMLMRASGGTVGNAAGESMSGDLEFFAPASSALYKQFKSHITFADTSGNVSTCSIAAMNYKATTAINAFQILPSSGNWTSGAAYMYALKKA